MRFDFEVAPEDEDMCQWVAQAALKGSLSPSGNVEIVRKE